MKLRVDATKEELSERGGDLLDALAKAVAPHAPDLADALYKALPPKESPLKAKALREQHKRERARYQRMLDRMNAEIADVLNEAFQKSEQSPDYTAKVVEMEAHAYEQVKAMLMQQGYKAEDFEEGGVLYGLSTNELREAVKQGRERRTP